jgi:hypothetical protein
MGGQHSKENDEEVAKQQAAKLGSEAAAIKQKAADFSKLKTAEADALKLKADAVKLQLAMEVEAAERRKLVWTSVGALAAGTALWLGGSFLLGDFPPVLLWRVKRRLLRFHSESNSRATRLRPDCLTHDLTI